MNGKRSSNQRKASGDRLQTSDKPQPPLCPQHIMTFLMFNMEDTHATACDDSC